MSQSMMRSRLWAVCSSLDNGRSMTSLMRSSLILANDLFRKTGFHFFGSCASIQFQPRESLQRIVRAHARYDVRRQMRRQRIVAVELPVRIVGREQEHFFRADLLDDVGDAARIARTVERLHGDADMVADDG